MDRPKGRGKGGKSHQPFDGSKLFALGKSKDTLTSIGSGESSDKKTLPLSSTKTATFNSTKTVSSSSSKTVPIVGKQISLPSSNKSSASGSCVEYSSDLLLHIEKGKNK